MNTSNTHPAHSIHPKVHTILLALSVAFLAIGFSAAAINVYCYLGLPIGTILFGLYLITKVLDKEMAAYVQDQHQHDSAPVPAVATGNSTFVPRGRTLVACR